MKKLLLVLIVLSPLWGLAQANKPVLQLEKASASGPVVLTVKPNRKIRLRTFDGDEFTFRRYSLIGDSLIATRTDTIALKDIKRLKGNIQGSVLRKVGGVALASVGGYCAVVGSTYGLLALVLGGNPLFILLSVPATGIAILGYELAGARRFNTSGKWQISIVDQLE